MEMKAALVTNYSDVCGEAPLWDGESETLYWVDTGRQECRALNTADGTSRRIPVDGFPQALGFRKDGGWICPMEDRVLLLDPDFRLEQELGSPLPPDSPLRLGDGTAGPDGAYYFGVYDPVNLLSKEGAVYRVNPDLGMEKVIGGMALPNGMAFTADGSTFYLTEMFGRRIWRFDFCAESGELSGKTLFAEIPENQGYPDGLICDENGGVWSAHWQGFRVTAYAPDGSVKAVVSLPVPTATCMAFGGGGELFVTTARKGCSRDQLKDYPDSGALFAARPKLKGLRERSFLCEA